MTPDGLPMVEQKLETPTIPAVAAKILEFLRAIKPPDGVIELRGLKCRQQYGAPKTMSGIYDGANLDKMATEAARLTLQNRAEGVYFLLNPAHPDLLAVRNNRCDIAGESELPNDEDILRRVLLLIDADPKRKKKFSSTDAEKAAALEILRRIKEKLDAAGWPAPIEADSGNGYHLVYAVDLPADDGGLVERCIKALSKEFSTTVVNIDTKVFNPSRICKVYGTHSRKGDHTVERPHRWSSVLKMPEELVPVPRELLEELAATAPSDKKPPFPKPKSGSRRGRRNGHSAPVAQRAAAYLEKLPDSIEGQHGSDRLFHAACVLVRDFDMPVAEALPLLAEWNERHAQPPWSEKELLHKLDGAENAEGPRGRLLNGSHSTNGYSRNGHAAGAESGAADDGATAEDGQERGEPLEGEAGDSEDLKPEIDAGNHNLETITAEAWDAIHQANRPPFLFRYGGAPGRIEQDDQGEPIIRLVDEDRMRHILARVASWTKEVGKGDEVSIESVAPPKDVVKDVLATPDMPLPILIRIVEAPIFANDGTLQTEPGYHPASRTLYVPADQFLVPQVPVNPTADEIDQARRLICDELLVDFPFTDDAERSHAVALLLLPFARDLISGATPLHLFEKPMPGTGATLLVDMLSFPATGRPIATMTEGRDEDEWRKRLTAKLRNSPTFLLIDNLRRRLDSGVVAAAITSPTWEDRLLGQTVMLKFQVRCGWMATGNNPVVSSEMSRRIIRIRLDAKMDRPWLRTGFKHPDLRGWARANREQLVWAALTLIRAWIAAGRPLGGIKLGMFEDWSEVMGGIMTVAGIPGFLSNLDKFYDESDAEGAQWRAFVAAWWAQHGTTEVKVAELFKLIGDDVTLPLGDGSDQSRKVRLGQMLTQARDRMFELEVATGESLATATPDTHPITVCIRRGDMKKRAYEWNLEEVGKPANEKTGESSKDSPETHPKTHPSCNVNVDQQLDAVEQGFGESGESTSNAIHVRGRARARAHARPGGKDSPDSPDSPAKWIDQAQAVGLPGHRNLDPCAWGCDVRCLLAADGSKGGGATFMKLVAHFATRPSPQPAGNRAKFENRTDDTQKAQTASETTPAKGPDRRDRSDDAADPHQCRTSRQFMKPLR